MREIADAIGDPSIERVTVLKSARIGFSTILTSAIGYHAVVDSCSILCLLPTEADCRDYIVERLFDASKALRGRLSGPKAGSDRTNRNTLTHRLFKGGDLKVVAGKAPRNLRRHTARILMVDEADAIEASAEGDPITLAERRTLSFANRKIIAGGTPLGEATSPISRLYLQWDMRLFEVPCISCGVFAEIRWSAIEWPEGRPEDAAWRCPPCHGLIGEQNKAQMLRQRRVAPSKARIRLAQRLPHKRALQPPVERCVGKARRRIPSRRRRRTMLRVFVNTILGEPWREQADEADDMALASRVEDFSLQNIPREVLALTPGIDTQTDRLECSILGHARDGATFVLGHEVRWGSPIFDNELWAEIVELKEA